MALNDLWETLVSNAKKKVAEQNTNEIDDNLSKTKKYLQQYYSSGSNSINNGYNNQKATADSNLASNKNYLQQYYSTGKDSINNSYNTQKNTADSNFEKTKNYLEQYYSSGKSDIETNYNASKNLLDKSYNTAVDRANSSYETDIDKLQRFYGSSFADLNRTKKTSEQTASVAREQLKKYLPEALKAQGLSGLGVSESSMLQAYNNYATDMAQIAADYNSNKRALDDNYNDTKLSLDEYLKNAIADADLTYQSNLTSLDTSKNSDLSELQKWYSGAVYDADINYQNNLASLAASRDSGLSELEKWYSNAVYEADVNYQNGLASLDATKNSDLSDLQRWYSDAVYNAEQYAYNDNISRQNEKYNEALSMINSGYYDDASALKKLLKNYEGSVSSQQYNTLLSLADSYTNRTAQNERFTEALNVIGEGSFNTAAELEEYIKTFEGKVSDSQYQTLMQNVKFLKNNPDEQQAAKDAAAAQESPIKMVPKETAYYYGGIQKSAKPNDTFVVKMGTTAISVDLGQAVADDNLAAYAEEAEIKNHQMFGYKNAVYIRHLDNYYKLEPATGYNKEFNKLYKEFCK